MALGRVSASKPSALDLAPEPGLRLTTEHVTTCDNGWAEVPAIAEAHVVGLGVTAGVRIGLHLGL